MIHKYITLTVLLLLITACGNTVTTNNTTENNTTNSSQCIYGTDNRFPDVKCTPGHVFPLNTLLINGKNALTGAEDNESSILVGDICTPGYTDNVRDVSEATKKEVYRRYGIANHTQYQYEIDHLISLELGGDNEISNLWPEPAVPKPGFREKDKVENWLHEQVCAGTMDIRVAQRGIARDWTQFISKAK